MGYNRYVLTTPDEQKLNVGDPTIGMNEGKLDMGAQSYGTVTTYTGEAVPTGQYTGHPAGAPFAAGDDASYAGAVATTSFTDNGKDRKSVV